MPSDPIADAFYATEPTVLATIGQVWDGLICRVTWPVYPIGPVPDSRPIGLANLAPPDFPPLWCVIDRHTGVGWKPSRAPCPDATLAAFRRSLLLLGGWDGWREEFARFPPVHTLPVPDAVRSTPRPEISPN